MQVTDLAGTLAVADLAGRLALVDQRLRSVLLEDDAVLGTASTRVAGGGGKRLRPALAIAAAALGGVFDDRVVSAATAVELVQIGSLVHDDLIDQAETRRGVPTIHAVEGANHALLAGDYILARAGCEAARVGAPAAKVLGRTVAELCVGQMLETETNFDPGRTIAAHIRSIDGKTAALFSCSLQLGALAAGLADPLVEALGRYGRRFGLAFQILDDVLDLTGDPQKLGKPVGTDVACGVYTLPVLLALQGESGDVLRRLLIDGDRGTVRQAAEFVQMAGTTATALEHAYEHADAAVDALADMDGLEGVAGLRAFPRRYLRWALDEFQLVGA